MIFIEDLCFWWTVDDSSWFGTPCLLVRHHLARQQRGSLPLQDRLDDDGSSPVGLMGSDGNLTMDVSWESFHWKWKSPEKLHWKPWNMIEPGSNSENHVKDQGFPNRTTIDNLLQGVTYLCFVKKYPPKRCLFDLPPRDSTNLQLDPTGKSWRWVLSPNANPYGTSF